MKTLWFLIVASGIGLTLPQVLSIDQHVAHAASKDDPSKTQLTCSVTVPETEWQVGQPVALSATVQNATAEDVNVLAVPTFLLSPSTSSAPRVDDGRDYSALWNWRTGTTLSPFSAISLRLSAGQSITAKTDLSKLLWTRLNWSVLPNAALFKVVPAGTYLLTLKVIEKNGGVLCSSHEARVVIRK